jgi:chorismate synthase
MNSFGRIFRVTIFGESHGPAIGITVDGCPAGIPLTEEHFAEDFMRRKSGSPGTTPRKEEDVPEIISGVFSGYTTGATLTVLVRNRNVRSSDYESLKEIPRPGHADFVALKKYGGFADYRGGGHFSGRLTTSLVAAGVIAKKIIRPILCDAKLVEAGGSNDIESAVNKGRERFYWRDCGMQDNKCAGRTGGTFFRFGGIAGKPYDFFNTCNQRN